MPLDVYIGYFSLRVVGRAPSALAATSFFCQRVFLRVIDIYIAEELDSRLAGGISS